MAPRRAGAGAARISCGAGAAGGTMTIDAFGVSFAAIGLDQAVTQCLARDPAARFEFVVTPNTDHLARLRRDPALRAIYRAAWLCLLDSQVIARLARFCGQGALPVVTGADLTRDVLEGLPAGSRVLLVGLDAADAAALAARFGGLVIAHHAPPMGLDDDPVAFARARDTVRASGAALVLLAIGSPRQERLAHAVWQAGDATGLGLCVGAAPLFAAGRIRRAPVWMRRWALEWLWRLVLEPRRLARRYGLDGPPVLLALAWRWCSCRRRRSAQ
ncbi:WecB/TagA/CpsF family glycosyltransferase [Acidiphilium sp. MT5]